MVKKGSFLEGVKQGGVMWPGKFSEGWHRELCGDWEGRGGVCCLQAGGGSGGRKGKSGAVGALGATPWFGLV